MQQTIWNYERLNTQKAKLWAEGANPRRFSPASRYYKPSNKTNFAQKSFTHQRLKPRKVGSLESRWTKVDYLKTVSITWQEKSWKIRLIFNEKKLLQHCRENAGLHGNFKYQPSRAESINKWWPLLVTRSICVFIGWQIGQSINLTSFSVQSEFLQ